MTRRSDISRKNTTPREFETAYVDWMLNVKKIVVCNCDYGCPCEFIAPPTKGYCEGLEAHEILEGHFGDVSLDGLRFAGLYRWPGPVHDGNGQYQAVIDKHATQPQIDALFKILSGEKQEPTTLFNIYGATIETEHEPIFEDIEFVFDLEKREGRFAAPNVMEAEITPIRNPVTGEAFEAILRLPAGFEYRDAQMASGKFWGKGEIPVDYEKRFAYLTIAAYGPYGVISEKSYGAATS